MCKVFYPTRLKISYITAILFSTTFLIQCAKAPNYSPIPEIEFRGVSKDVMLQGEFNKDSIILQVGFKDGDGDIGTTSETEENNLFIIDTRTNKEYGAYKVPPIPLQGANNGIEGTMLIKLYSTCCQFPDGTAPCLAPPKFPTDKLSLEIYLIDKAGHKSNVIQTNEITLLCQ